MKIGNIITEKKDLKGLTTYKLAKLSGVEWQTVKNIEKGNNCTLLQLEPVLKALGGTLEVKWDEEPKKEL